MSDTIISIPLFREDLTYDELHDLVKFLMARELARVDLSAEKLSSMAADCAVTRALIADEIYVKPGEPYSDFDVDPLKRCIALAPEFLKERLEATLWDYNQKIAVRAEEALRRIVKTDAMTDARQSAAKEALEWQANWYENEYYG